MSDLLFAVPWWIPTLLAVIGIALFVNGNKSQVRNVRNAGVGLVLLAIIWALVSYLVDTDKEKVEKATRLVVQTAVDGDWNKFQSHLTPSATLFINEGVKPSGAPTITAFAKVSCETVRLRSASVQHMVIEQAGPVITVHCDILSVQDQSGGPASSSWQFEWERSGKEWKLREIRVIRLPGVALDQVRDVFQRPK